MNSKFFKACGVLSFLFFSASGLAALIQNDRPSQASDIKLDHRFGAGLMVAGGAGIMGLALDVNLNPFFSTSAYLGTGYEFNSVGVKAQYYILGASVHPFIGAGYAHWFASPGILNLDKINPSLIYGSLLNDDQKARAFKEGFALHLIYPTFGIQFVHESQFSLSAELMYLFDISDFSGNPYFGVGSYYYF